MKKTNKIFIANRGEIAVRIIKSARELGIFTVSAYTKNDEASLHVKLADKSLLLEGNSLDQTFLSVEKMIELAISEKCEAIHPGYGFISENPEFPKRCKEKGLIFIGPSAEIIQLLGNKVKARSFAKSIGIPIISGFSGSATELLENAKYLDFPMMIKPLAGGGGKGIFVVEEENSLHDSLQKAAREAQSYFNNPELYVEHYFDKARHIEVQLLGDHHGNLIHLYDRECSLQRRYQKIIEEAPAPSISEKIRGKIIEAAVKIGKAVGYFSAGTVEFLVDKNKNFYFLEMNTRIQVEHGVTELVTGIDIVKEQINIASGEKLPITQSEVVINGHAIEARIYAEDPLNDFIPMQGEIKKHSFLVDNNSRVDTHLTDNMQLPQTYDSLLGKVLGWGNNRKEATENLQKNLAGTVIIGLRNNLAFLQLLLVGSDFEKMHFHAKYIERNKHKWQKQLKDLSDKSLEAIAISYLIIHFLENKQEPKNIWEEIGYKRLKNEITVHINGKNISLGWKKRAEGINLTIGGNSISRFEYQIKNGIVTFQLIDQIYQLPYFEDKDCTYVHYLGMSYKAKSNNILSESTMNKSSRNAEVGLDNNISSPLFGKVVALNCKQGDKISKGDTLLVLESMKTENNILSQGNGFVEKIHVIKGEQVAEGQLLIGMLSTKEILKKLELN